MAKENLANGLEQEVAEKKVKAVQTPEQLAEINAGLELLEQLNFDSKALELLKALAPVWKSGDVEALAAAKAQIIEAFGGSKEFKDYVGEEFKTALAPFAGIVRMIPIANNIVSFYGRRPSAEGRGRVKMISVTIDGKIYNVDANYFATLADKSREEKRELVLAHPATKEATVTTVEEL